jgi:membrane-bound lytic murein transglycosylase D
MHDSCTLARLLYLVTALFISAGAFGCATTQSPAPASTAAQPAAKVEKTVGPAQARPLPMKHDPGMVTYYRTPRRIDFCGESVPLEQQEVLERFDKEFTLVVNNHAQVYWWLKHEERYFPSIEERLRRLNMPDDLKYVALVESEPLLSAPARRRSVDMRHDFELSPDSALAYLMDLYRSFNSWPLALAAYNYGEKRVMDESGPQGGNNFYQMMLPQEAERYVFRVMAIKAVLSDPRRYGYQLPQGAGYR